MVAEEVLEVPLGGGGEGAFEADEEGTVFGFGEFAQALDGGVLDRFVPLQADEGAAAGVAHFVDRVFGEVVASGAGVVELEAVLEADFVEDRLLSVFVKGEEERAFFIVDVAAQGGDVFGLRRFGVGLELAARKVRLLQLVNFEARIGNRLRLVAVAFDHAFDAFDGDGGDGLVAGLFCW